MTDNYNLRKLFMAEIDKEEEKEKERDKAKGGKGAKERAEEAAETQRKVLLLPIVKALDALKDEHTEVDGIEIRGLREYSPEVRLGIEWVYISMRDGEFAVQADSGTTYYGVPEEAIQAVRNLIGKYVGLAK